MVVPTFATYMYALYIQYVCCCCKKIQTDFTKCIAAFYSAAISRNIWNLCKKLRTLLLLLLLCLHLISTFLLLIEVIKIICIKFKYGFKKILENFKMFLKIFACLDNLILFSQNFLFIFSLFQVDFTLFIFITYKLS